MAGTRETSQKYKPGVGGSVTEMVRVSLQDGERPIELFQQNDARQFMGDSHFSKRQGEICMISGVLGKAVGGANGEYERRGIPILMASNELRQFFGSDLLSAGIEQDEVAAGIFGFAAAEFQQCRFVFERRALDFGVLLEALQVFIGERLDCRAFRLADPCDCKFHGLKKILTAEIAEIAQRAQRRSG